MKILKRILSVCIIFAMTLAEPVSAMAYDASAAVAYSSAVSLSQGKTPDEIRTQIAETYAKAKAIKGKSNFNGWCGMFVGAQLEALGISVKTANGFTGNGNTWYTYLLDNIETESGHTQVKYAGANCLQDIVNANGGNPVYNIVVSWPYSYGADRSFGHVVFIHAIIDGQVYYCESYGTSFGAEGTPIARDMNQMMAEYNGLYGEAYGATWFDGEITVPVDRETLFTVYPYYLTEGTYLDSLISNGNDLIYLALEENDSSGADRLKSYMYCIKNGISVVLDELFGTFEWKDSPEEEMIDEVTLDLINTIMQNESLLSDFIGTLDKDMSQIKKAYDLTKTAGRMEFSKHASQLLNISEKEFSDEMEKWFEDSETVIKYTKKGMDIAQVIAVEVEIEVVNREIVDRLMEMCDKYGHQNSTLATGLYRLQRKLDTNTVKRIFENLSSDYVINKLEKLLTKTMVEWVFGKDVASAYGVANMIMSLGETLIYEKLFKGTTVTDLVKTIYKKEMSSTLSSIKLAMCNESLRTGGNAVSPSDYELVWNAHAMSVASTLSSAKKITKNGTVKSAIDDSKSTILKYCSWDRQFKLIRNKVLEAINNQCVRMKDVEVSSSNAQNSATVVKNRFDNVIKLYPSESSQFTVMYNGKIGNAGFAEFVYRMIFENSINFKINSEKQYQFSSYSSLEKIGTVSGSSVNAETVKNLLANAKLGDVIQACGNQYGSKTMMLYSRSDTGIKVYDCGFNSAEGSDSEYGVLMHELTYAELVSWLSQATDMSEGGISVYHAANYDYMYKKNSTVYADDSESFEIEDGVLIKYNGYRSHVIIPSEVTAIADNAFNNKDSVQSVEIPSTVKTIGDNAFYDCDNLTAIFIPDSVESVGSQCFYSCDKLLYAKLSNNMTEIKQSTFEGCKKLETVMMGKEITAIESNAFNNCYYLKDIDISDSTTIIKNEAFRNCLSLTNIEIPNTVTEIGTYAFLNCKNLTTVKLSKKLERLGYGVFANCSVLKSIEIPKSIRWVSGGGTKSSGVFSNCTQLDVTFEDGITKIPCYLFRGCEWLTEMEIPDTVTEIDDYAFGECENLVKIELPKNIESLGDGAFWKCNSLEKINIPKSLSKTERPFVNCINLKEIYFEKGRTVLPASLFAGCGVEKIDIPNTVSVIEHSVFFGCENLTDIEIPDTVTEIGDEAFYGCVNLKYVKLSKNLNKLGEEAFRGCSMLKEIEIPKKLEYVEGRGTEGVFYDCTQLKEVTFENGITTIPAGLFRGCQGIEKIEIPNTVTKIGSAAFFECVNLKDIKIPNSVTEIDSSTFYYCINLEQVILGSDIDAIGDYAFSGCHALNEIELPLGLKNIGTQAFSFTGLQKVIIPNGCSSIGDEAFYKCDNLTEVIAISEYLSIGNGAFEKCKKLEKVVLSEGVTSIGRYTFQSCESLSEIAIPDSVTSLGSEIFDGCGSLADVHLGTGIIEIPSYAFSNCGSIQTISLPYSIISIGSNAFINDAALAEITIPRKTESIPSNAFSYPDKLTIYGVAGTYAESFASENSIKFVAKEVNADSVKLDKTALTLNTGSKEQLIMTVSPMDFTDTVTWKSTDTNVVTVSDTGVITAVGTGTASVKLTVGNASASCKVTVLQPVTSIYLYSQNMNALETYELYTNIYPSNANNQKLEWSSSDSAVASVDENGLVTAHKKGTAVITAKATDGSGVSGKCTVTVLNSVNICASASKLESPHNYEDKCSDYWVYTSEGAKSLNVTFDSRTELEDGFDYIYIYDADNIEIGKYTGSALAGKTINIVGDTVRIHLVSDNSGNEWGFKVTKVEASKTANKTYTIKYNANGGSGSMSDQTITYGVSTVTRANTFKKNGYTFAGWTAYRAS
ncbi:MAG: leucine-rich repeat protein, partial [Butyrivibrio sp.]|nr:leucine-rich repeat protein [Butyrivibrio sp.]